MEYYTGGINEVVSIYALIFLSYTTNIACMVLYFNAFPAAATIFAVYLFVTVYSHISLVKILNIFHEDNKVKFK